MSEHSDWHVEFIHMGMYYEGIEYNLESEMDVVNKIRQEFPNASIQVVENYAENPQHEAHPVSRVLPRSEGNRRVSGA